MTVINQFDEYDHFVTVILVSVILGIGYFSLNNRSISLNGHFGGELMVILAIKRSFKSEITAILVVN